MNDSRRRKSYAETLLVVLDRLEELGIVVDEAEDVRSLALKEITAPDGSPFAVCNTFTLNSRVFAAIVVDPTLRALVVELVDRCDVCCTNNMDETLARRLEGAEIHVDAHDR